MPAILKIERPPRGAPLCARSFSQPPPRRLPPWPVTRAYGVSRRAGSAHPFLLRLLGRARSGARLLGGVLGKEIGERGGVAARLRLQLLGVAVVLVVLDEAALVVGAERLQRLLDFAL